MPVQKGRQTENLLQKAFHVHEICNSYKRTCSINTNNKLISKMLYIMLQNIVDRGKCKI